MVELVGGWASKSVDDEQVKIMAAFAVPHVQGDINHSSFFKLNNIKSVEAQVVSGMNYRITMELEETTGDAASYSEDIEYVAASPSGKVECTVVVYDQPWTGTRKITSKSCGEIY